MHGVALAGGSCTRLFPITEGKSKKLMPIYDKPKIYYLLSTLMMTGRRDIPTITTPECKEQFRARPGGGLVQAFILGEDLVGDDSFTLTLSEPRPKVVHDLYRQQLLSENR